MKNEYKFVFLVFGFFGEEDGLLLKFVDFVVDRILDEWVHVGLLVLRWEKIYDLFFELDIGFGVGIELAVFLFPGDLNFGHVFLFW